MGISERATGELEAIVGEIAKTDAANAKRIEELESAVADIRIDRDRQEARANAAEESARAAKEDGEMEFIAAIKSRLGIL